MTGDDGGAVPAIAGDASAASPAPLSLMTFVTLVFCFIVLLCACLVPGHMHSIFHTPMARYSVYVLKVPSNTSQPTNRVN